MREPDRIEIAAPSGGWAERRWRVARRRIRETVAVRRAEAATGQRYGGSTVHDRPAAVGPAAGAAQGRPAH